MVITSHLSAQIRGAAARMALPIFVALCTPAAAQTATPTTGVAGAALSTQYGAVSLPAIAEGSAMSATATSPASAGASTAGGSGPAGSSSAETAGSTAAGGAAG